jgi:putative nucleotidyltransferase with HDIG domain
MVSKADPRYGRGVVEVDGWVDGQDVLASLKETFASPTYSPPKLPAMAMELFQLSQQANVSFPEVAKLLERDPVVCGDVLKVAQSPAYAGRVQVQSIPQALSRLGLTALRDLVFQTSMNAKVFRAKPYQGALEQLRTHCQAVAYASRIVCRYTAFDDNYAFLCGLLHDVGRAGALISMADGNEKPPPLEEILQPVDEVHAEASEIMVRRWGLPEEVALVVGAHHTVSIQGYAHPLAAAVGFADRLVREAGLTSFPAGAVAQRHGELKMAKLVQLLGLSEKQVSLIWTEVQSTVEDLKA